MRDRILILNPDNQSYGPLLKDFGETTSDHNAFILW